MEIYKKSLFVFRRDLRLDDNTALIEACKRSDQVIVCFIFDTKQVGSKNSYRSEKSIQFMIESLKDLEKQVKSKTGKLHYFYGDTQKIFPGIIKETQVEAIFLNKDYTPFALKRDKDLLQITKQEKIGFHIYDDALLVPPQCLKTTTGGTYTVFTPFFKKAALLPVDSPQKFTFKNLLSLSLKESVDNSIFTTILDKKDSSSLVKGGTAEGLKIINDLAQFKNYAETRNLPTKPTSLLAAHNKFGTVSIRYVYHQALSLKVHSDFIKQLYWRDFFTQLAYYYPHVFGKAFREKYQKIKWKNSTVLFEKWCNGTTGFPFVDAGMRELNKTGFMHNRLRMLVASFLVKNLHCDWRWGEKYFAQKLVDYDPCVNNGSWQWAASTGADAQPYFRIFNAWTQQKKFDPECEYIKKWVPELESIDPKIIHKWNNKYDTVTTSYPAPCVDHTITSREAKTLFQ